MKGNARSCCGGLRSPEPDIRITEPEIRNTKSGTRTTEPETRNPEPETRRKRRLEVERSPRDSAELAAAAVAHTEYETRNTKSQSWHLKHGTRNLTHETRNPELGTRNPFFFFTLVTGPGRSLRLKLSDTRVYEPQIRARNQVEEARAVRALRARGRKPLHPKP